jgi:hypothetical protein
MLVNLLARQDRIVERVLLECPAGVSLAGRVVPLARRDADLRGALLDGALEIGCVPVVQQAEAPESAIRLVVGPGRAVHGAMRVHGERWWGGVSCGSIPGNDADSHLPYGPYAAACLAAGEIYLSVRLKDSAPRPAAAFYSTWSLRSMTSPPTVAADIGPSAVEGVELEAIVAGAGAVGSTWVHAVWATNGLTGRAVVADADKFGVDVTNLNRCPVFATRSLGNRKASEAARICADAPVEILPVDGPVGDVPERPGLLISAVDTNASRRDVQGLYPPRLLAASTHNLRAEVLRCDPIAGAPCISCFNPPETDVPDAELRREFLAATEDEKHVIAADVGIPVEEAERWAVAGTCGYATDRLLDRLRANHDGGVTAFAVGFVSVMAGTMLAAQTVREVMDDRCLNGTLARAVMQFLQPTATTNRPLRQLRDGSCPMCDPDELATRIWQRRHVGWSVPSRKGRNDMAG